MCVRNSMTGQQSLELGTFPETQIELFSSPHTHICTYVFSCVCVNECVCVCVISYLCVCVCDTVVPDLSFLMKSLGPQMSTDKLKTTHNVSNLLKLMTSMQTLLMVDGWTLRRCNRKIQAFGHRQFFPSPPQKKTDLFYR